AVVEKTVNHRAPEPFPAFGITTGRQASLSDLGSPPPRPILRRTRRHLSARKAPAKTGAPFTYSTRCASKARGSRRQINIIRPVVLIEPVALRRIAQRAPLVLGQVSVVHMHHPRQLSAE